MFIIIIAIIIIISLSLLPLLSYMQSAMICRVHVLGISVLNYDDEEISAKDILATVNVDDRTVIEVTSSYLILNRHYNITLNVNNNVGSNTLNLMLSRL